MARHSRTTSAMWRRPTQHVRSHHAWLKSTRRSLPSFQDIASCAMFLACRKNFVEKASAEREIQLASPAIGHWGTCPLEFQLFNFSRLFRTAQTLTFDSMCLPIQKKIYWPIALWLFIPRIL